MKKILTLTLLLVFLCALTLTFTACSLFETQIVGKYCAQIDGKEFTNNNFSNNGVEYVYWQIKDFGDKIIAYYQIFYFIGDGPSIFEFVMTSSGRKAFAEVVSFILLTKDGDSYVGTASCNMTDTQEVASTFTYTLTREGNSLKIECKDNTTQEIDTYTLQSTDKTYKQYMSSVLLSLDKN